MPSSAAANRAAPSTYLASAFPHFRRVRDDEQRLVQRQRRLLEGNGGNGGGHMSRPCHTRVTIETDRNPVPAMHTLTPSINTRKSSAMRQPLNQR